jgi:LPXTG-site transpeptidase (sortase) family protein
MAGRRPRVLLGLLLIAAVAVAGAVVSRPEATPGDPNLGERAGRLIALALRPIPVGPAPAPRPALPIPEELPADPYEPTPAIVVGTIEIPKLGLVEEIQRGVTLTAIDRGPGWWPGTAEPGGLGNTVIAGHRTTHSRPFARLHELDPGDQVVMTTVEGRFVYEVRGVIVVPADWIDIAAQSEAHTATLFACHPPGSARERIVAKLRLMSEAGEPLDPDHALPAMDAEAQRPDHTLVVRPRTEITIRSDGSGEFEAGDPFASLDG